MSHAEKKMLRTLDPAKCRVTGHVYPHEVRPRADERCACGTLMKCTACGVVHVEVLLCRVCAALQRKERKAARA